MLVIQFQPSFRIVQASIREGLTNSESIDKETNIERDRNRIVFFGVCAHERDSAVS